MDLDHWRKKEYGEVKWKDRSEETDTWLAQESENERKAQYVYLGPESDVQNPDGSGQTKGKTDERP